MSCSYHWASIRADTRARPHSFHLRGRMRSFLLIVAAGLMMLLIAVGSNMARSARANAHTAVIATQR